MGHTIIAERAFQGKPEEVDPSYLRVTDLRTRKKVWARLVRNEGAATEMIGSFQIEVLGWNMQARFLDDVSPVDLQRLKEARS